MLRGKLTSPPAHRDVQRRTSATSICERICKAHIFDETFGVNSAFNAEVLVAPPHAVAMEFDLFWERRRGHWVSGAKLGGGLSPAEQELFDSEYELSKAGFTANEVNDALAFQKAEERDRCFTGQVGRVRQSLSHSQRQKMVSPTGHRCSGAGAP